MAKKKSSTPTKSAAAAFEEWRSNLVAVLRKAASVNSQPTEASFPELPNVLVWMRAALGLAYGILMGYRGVRSGAIVLQAFNLITFVPVMYCRLFLGTATGTFDMSILFAGSFQALALAVLVWTIGFTSAHGSDEQKLASLLVLQATVGASGSDTAAGGTGGGASEAVGTEF